MRDTEKNICGHHPPDHYTGAGKSTGRFIRQTADEFAEQNNVETLLSELERLHHHYEQQQLPVTRQEFENRSMLYHILEDMKAFLDIKKDFITAR